VRKYVYFKSSTFKLQPSKLIAKIDRNADLIQEIYFSFELPEIRKRIVRNSDDVIIGDDFRFVKSLGEVI